MKPVSERRIRIAKEAGLQNVEVIAVACREAGVTFPVACALFQKESGGRNVFGNDKGGALSGFPGAVTKDTYAVFRWLVMEKGQTSNGVGPAQITYAGGLMAVPRDGDGGRKRDGGFFRQMEAQGLKPWDVHDNMLFGLRLLKSHFKATGSWTGAGERYNGARSYGEDLAVKIEQWRQRFVP